MTVTIFIEDGRLGNQLHQYACLRSFFPKSTFVLIGFNDLKLYSGFVSGCTDRVFFVENNFLKKLFRWISRRFLALKLASCLSESKDRSSINISKICIPISIFVVAKGYFQSNNFISRSSWVKPSIDLQLKARSWFLDRKIDSRFSCYFIHVRRGDYLNSSTFDFPEPPALPLRWYVDQVTYILKKFPKALFILSSDEIEWARDMFGAFSSIVFAPGDPNLDLVIMQNCLGGGILSPSSYSLWAAQFIFRMNPSAILLAPSYWVGWPAMQWYPPNVEMPWLRYVPVSKIL